MNSLTVVTFISFLPPLLYSVHPLRIVMLTSSRPLSSIANSIVVLPLLAALMLLRSEAPIPSNVDDDVAAAAAVQFGDRATNVNATVEDVAVVAAFVDYATNVIETKSVAFRVDHLDASAHLVGMKQPL